MVHLSSPAAKKYLWSLAILIIAVAAYIPIFTNDFTNWDDNIFVTSNELIQSFSWANIHTWFTGPFVGQYQPLILLSFAVDYAIDGYNPLVFHITNLLLHLFNIFLVFRLIDLLFKNSFIALLTSLLFGIHTLNVESVAWITERKNVLYTMFYLWSLVSYLKYLENKKFRFFLYSLLLFILSLFSKAAAVTLPIVLILFDYLHQRNLIKRLVVLEKLPFFALSLFFGIITIIAHSQYGALTNATGYPFSMRIMISAKALVFYFQKLFLPLHLSAYYPLPAGLQSKLPELILTFALVYLILAGFVIFSFIKKNKYIIFGFVFFIANLCLFVIPAGVPVIATDRYAYVPFIGMFVIISYGLYFITNNFPQIKRLVLLIVSIYIILLGVLTYQRSAIWKDSITLWNNVIQTKGETSFPLMKRGIAYRNLNEYEKALDDFNVSIELNNQYPVVFENRGYIYLMQKDYQKAALDFNQAVNMDPKSAYALRNLGLCCYYLDNYEESLANLNQSLEIEPDNAYALKTRGKVFIALDQIDNACIDLQRSIALGLTEENETEARELIGKHCSKQVKGIK